MSVRAAAWVVLSTLVFASSCRRKTPDTTGETQEISCSENRPGGLERWIHDDEPTWGDARRADAWCSHGSLGAVARTSVFECANARYVEMADVDGWRRSFYEHSGEWRGIQERGMAGTACAGTVPSSVTACRA